MEDFRKDKITFEKYLNQRFIRDEDYKKTLFRNCRSLGIYTYYDELKVRIKILTIS